MFTGAVSKEWELEVELKITGTQSSWSNVLEMKADGVSGDLGARSPAVFMRPNQDVLHICSNIDDQFNSCFDSASITLNEWTKLKISQKQKDNGIYNGIFGVHYMYEVEINDVLVHSAMQNNPLAFDAMTGKMSNGWTAALGEYQNFSFEPNYDSGTISGHTVNPALNQLFIDQYRIWDNMRDPITGFYCDQMSTTAVSTCTSFYSSASTGWGMMIDAVAAETGLLATDKARERTMATMNNINENWPRDSRGWFAHWTESDYSVVGEYSTIDSSIMV